MRACIYILLLKVLLTEGVHQNYSYYDCKAGYLSPYEDCNIPPIELPPFYPLTISAIDEVPDPLCVYKCIETEKCVVAAPTCPVPPICPDKPICLQPLMRMSYALLTRSAFQNIVNVSC